MMLSNSGEKGFCFSLRFVTLFAAAHVVLVFLQSNFVPLSGGWNMVWLGLELLLGVGAFVLSLGCYLYAVKNKTPSLVGFRTLFRDILSPGSVLLLLWVLWAYIACLLAIREGRTSFYHNVRYLFYQTADLLVLFPLGVYYGRRGETRLLRALYDMCLTLFTLQLVYGFYQFFRGNPQFSAFFGRKFDFSILRAIFGVNSNHTGAYAAFFLIAGIWRFRNAASRAGKAALIAAFLVSFAAFAMVESRGAIFGVTAAVGVYAGAASWRRHKKGAFTGGLCSLLCCVLAAGAFLALFYGTRACALSVQNNVLARVYETTSDPLSPVSEEADTVSTAEAAQSADAAVPEAGSTSYIAPAAGADGDKEMRGLIGKGASTLGGRKKIWLTVIRGASKDFHILLHGTSMANTSDWVATVLGKAFRTHNQFLELLVAQGLPALILFLLWLLWLAGRSVRLGLDGESKTNWVLPLPLLALIIHNMVEMMLVARPHVVCGFFYLIAGYVVGFTPQENKNESIRINADK